MDERTLALKHRDIEEPIDILVYRPLGARLARRLAGTSVTPNQVTVASGMVGVACGHLLFYDSVLLTAAGLLAFFLSDLLDSVDGQLARLTGKTSRLGKILDGACDGARYVSIYAHLAGRLFAAGASWWVFVAAAAAFASQALQNGMVEYYRHAYLACALPGGYAGFESKERTRELVAASKHGASLVERFLLAQYRDWVTRQELLAPVTSRLHRHLADRPEGDRDRVVASALAATLGKPLLPYLAVLATNLRMLALFAMLAAGRADWFFPFTIVGLNGALALLVWLHERRSAKVMQWFLERETR